MSRAFVIEGARINCQYGECEACLMILGDRHIAVGKRLFGNETDIRADNLKDIIGTEWGSPRIVPEYGWTETSGDRRKMIQNSLEKKANQFIKEINESSVNSFKTCKSPYVTSYPLALKDFVETAEQAQAVINAAGGEMPICDFSSVIPWQNANETVHIGSFSDISLRDMQLLLSIEENDIIEAENQWQAKVRLGNRALMENSWTVCSRGMGIISLISTGQPDEDKAQEILERLTELERLVDLYMEENNLDVEQREGLLDSMLLWGGYTGQDIFWEYESTSVNRNFCTYLQQQNPYLYSYFERGIYLADQQGGKIDLSYMLGINKALNQGRFKKECIGEAMLSDRGMRNGYYEACRGSRGLGTGDFLREFLNGFTSPDYDAYARYEDYYNAAQKEVEVSHYASSGPQCRPLSKEEYGEYMEEVFAQFIRYGITTGKRKEQEVEAQSRAQSFLKLLQQDMQRGN